MNFMSTPNALLFDIVLQKTRLEKKKVGPHKSLAHRFSLEE